MVSLMTINLSLSDAMTDRHLKWHLMNYKTNIVHAKSKIIYIPRVSDICAPIEGKESTEL